MFSSSADNGGRGRAALGVIVGVLVLLQLVLGNHVSVFGAKPGFMLVLTGVVALSRGSRAGAIAGFGAGLLFDLLGTGPVGLSSLLGSVAGYALGRGQRNLFADGWKVPLAQFAVASLAYNALYFLFLLAFSLGLSLDAVVMARVLASTLLDIAVAAGPFWLLALANHANSLGSGGLRMP